MNSINTQFVTNNKNSILFSLVICIVSFVVLLFAFSQNNKPVKIDYIYTGCFFATVLIPILINQYILMPLLLKQERYILFTLLFVINILLFTQLNRWFFLYFIDYLFPDYYFISYHSNTKLITIFSVFLVGTTLLKLAEDWFYFNRDENRLLKIENQQIQTQLSSLRSQINPHFLFNSLNVIYALAIEKKDETKDAIVQLSDVLRYIIYDSNTEQVALKDEVKLLKNYIEFQKFRHYESEKIHFTHHINNENYPIYPMLLLPLVENSYKYGMKNDLNNTFISINLFQKNNEFTFSIENNYNEDAQIEPNEYSGVGIENIKKNLEIVYPNKHEFKISKSRNTFSVLLKLLQNAD